MSGEEQTYQHPFSNALPVLWNGEEATLLDIRTPEQQRAEWLSDPDVVEGWYESGEDEEPMFEIFYEVRDGYGASHLIIGDKEFDLIQQGYCYCTACGQIRQASFISKRRLGDCVCFTCIVQPLLRKFRVSWIDEEEAEVWWKGPPD